jgi:hypothetical protein
LAVPRCPAVNNDPIGIGRRGKGSVRAIKANRRRNRRKDNVDG